MNLTPYALYLLSKTPATSRGSRFDVPPKPPKDAPREAYLAWRRRYRTAWQAIRRQKVTK